MKIKKVDDRPMVIRTKKKIRLHSQEPKVLAVKRNRASSGQQMGTGNIRKGILSGFRKSMARSRESVKIKDRTLYVMGAAGSSAAAEQLDGGEEFLHASMVGQGLMMPVFDSASKGKELFLHIEREKAGQQIKEADQRKKIAKRSVKENIKKVTKHTAKKTAKRTTKDAAKATAKETAKITTKAAVTTAAAVAGTMVAPGAGTTMGYAVGEAAGMLVAEKIEHADMIADTRARKLRYFLDKMNAQEQQKDSFGKLVRDVLFRRIHYHIIRPMAMMAPVIMAVLLLIVMVTVPVVGSIGVLYNSPYAVFLPPLEEGETIRSLAGSYVAEFQNEVEALAAEHTGADEGRVLYADYEGAGAPSNLYDILAVYMVRYGIGDTATIVNDTSRARLQEIVDDMCTYTASIGTETSVVINDEGTEETVTTTYLNVNVTLSDWQDMIDIYGFTEEEQELLADMLSPENIALLGPSPETGGGNMQSSLTEEEISAILSLITDPVERSVCSYALHRVGYPYSQELRDSGEYYDCSSLAYYSWKDAGVDISHGGATTAAAEAQGLHGAGATVVFGEMRPGDLIFYSTSTNGRFMNITHVAIYIGDGKVVEALNRSRGVIMQDVRTANIVMIGRPVR